MLNRLTALFPLWAVLFCAIAYLSPAWFTGLKPYIIYLLGVVMFGMGMTLRLEHFVSVFKHPLVIGFGVLLQYLLMPLIAWALSVAFEFPPMLLVGMVLVGASPGGTASNVICYLARGDVALSITLTTVSTLLAIVAMPLLTLLYAGYKVDVPARKMLLDVLKIVIVPVLLGVFVNHLLGRHLASVKRIFPLLSVLAIVVIIAIIIALNQRNLSSIAPTLVLAVVLHNGLGLILGYWLARLSGYTRVTARTLCIEVGMQNSGLAVAMAIKYFSSISALPGALFSIWHNLSGAMLASWWARSIAIQTQGSR